MRTFVRSKKVTHDHSQSIIATMYFWKYQGAGNDFIMLDQREQTWLTRANTAQIERLCDRHFGVGADGLILLQPKEGYDFEMVYFNADGRESTLCGNGGRCVAAFAQALGVIGAHGHFWAIDGPHEAIVAPKADGSSWVELKMGDVGNIQRDGEAFVLNTGSPHYIRFETGIAQLDMRATGRAVRYSDTYKAEGINVNVVEMIHGEDANPTSDIRNPKSPSLSIRTYERGVEDETLACGTGVTAAALAWHRANNGESGAYEVPVKAQGGQLSVRFTALSDGTFSDIWLCGPAAAVFKGEM